MLPWRANWSSNAGMAVISLDLSFYTALAQHQPRRARPGTDQVQRGALVLAVEFVSGACSR